MKRTLLTLAVALSIAAAGTFVSAAPAPYLQKHMQFGNQIAMKNLFAGKFLLKFKDTIGLTADQVAKIEKMNFSFQESLIKTTADLKLKELKMANYLKADKVNRKQAENMLREIASIKTGMQLNRLNYMLDLREVLTPEQRVKIENMKKNRMRRMNMNRSGMRGKRPVRAKR